MEPICLVTDTHLGIYKSADIWHEVVLSLFTDIADECTRRNITKIIHLGDFFDNRRVLNVKTLNYAHTIAKMLDRDFETYIIRGNHDQYFKNISHPHSLVVFEQYKNIHVVDHPIVIDSIGLVPWMEDFSDLKCDILMGHFEINGFKMNDGYIMRRAHLNASDFKKFKQVISGHFHMPNSDTGSIYYLGSPYQQDFGDTGSERGYYVFSPIDNGGDFEFIPFTDAPQYILADTEDINFDKIEGNIVKLVFQKDYGTIRNTEIVDEVQMMKPLYLYTDFTEAAVELTEDIIDDKVEMRTEKEIVKSYVDKSECPDGLEKPTILSMFNTLIDSVLEDMK